MVTVWCLTLGAAFAVASFATSTGGDWRLEYPPWGESDSATHGSPTIWFPMVIPFTRHGCGPSRYMSMRIAVNHVNRRDSTFCPAIGRLRSKFELQYDLADSNANGLISAKAIYKFLGNRSAKVKVVLGPNSSGSSMSVSNILAVFRIAHMSWAATHGQLSNKEDYPMFFRVVAPDSLTMTVLAGWIHHLKFEMVNLAYFDAMFQSGQAGDFLQAGRVTYGLIVNEFKMPSSGSGGRAISDENMIRVRSVLREILYTRIRVVVALAINEEAYDFFLAINDMHMMSESGWLWCGGDGFGQGMAAGNLERLKYFKGVVFLTPDAQHDGFIEFRQKWAELMPTTRRPEFSKFELCYNKTSDSEGICNELSEFVGWQDGKHDVELLCTSYTALAYDAVVTLAVVADNIISKGKNIGQVTNEDWLEELRDLSNSHDSFECLTGNISFNKNQERDMEIAFYNWQDTMDTPLVMTWDGINSYKWKIGATVVWPGGKSEIVTDSMEFTVPTGLPPKCAAGLMYNLVTRLCEVCPEGSMYLEEVLMCVCTPGYARNGSTGVCSACMPGQFSLGVGTTMCRDCRAGKFTSEAAATQCASCSQGKYQEKQGMSTCFYCQDHITERIPEKLRLTTRLMGADKESECVCKAGTYMSCATHLCAECGEGLLCPIDGLAWGSCSQECSEMANVTQSTPKLAIGYMSQSESPLSILTCVGSVSCAASRCLPVFEYASSVCAGRALGPRCAECLPGWYMTSEYECQNCAELKGGGRFVRVGVIFTFQLVTISIAYIQQARGSIESEHARMFKTLIPFVQQILAFESLQLKQPDFLKAPAWTVNLLSFMRLFEFLEFPDGCVGSLEKLILRNACLPLVPFADFAIISLICFIRRKRPSMDIFINLYLGIMCSLFVSLARMGVIMFPREAMPNGDYYLVEFPYVKFLSKQWWRAGLLSIAICLMFCAAVTAYIIHAIVVMPRKAASNPGFVLRHDFMLDSARCQCWWWILVEIFFAIMIALVKTLIVTVFFQIYMLIFCVVFMLVALFRFRPYEHMSVNWIQILLKVALLCILVSMTGMVDYEKQPLDLSQDLFGYICLTAFCVAISTVLCATMAQVAELRVPEASRYARSVKLAYHIRDTMQVINLMPERQFLAFIHGLGDTDRRLFKDVLKVFVGVFLQEQPGPRLWQQRVMENVIFKVWSPHETTAKALRAMQSGEAERALAKSAELRVNLHKLVYGIRDSHQHISERDRKFRRKSTSDALKSETLDEDMFKRRFVGMRGLTSANLHDLFDLLDTDCNGFVSRNEIVSAAEGLVYEDFNEEEISFEQASQTVAEFKSEERGIVQHPSHELDSDACSEIFSQLSAPECEDVYLQSLVTGEENPPVLPLPCARVELQTHMGPSLEQLSL